MEFILNGTIDSERDGTQQTLIADGLLIQSSNGTLSLIVNNVQDLSGGGGGGGGTAGLDGLTGLEDAQLIVGAGDLTQNDVVGGIRGNGVGGIPGTLTVTGVSNAQHGTVALVNGVITYTPEANWFTEKQTYNPDRTEVKDAAGNTIFTHVAGREAGFDYSVTASNGATATFHADVAVKNVNDKPVVSVVPQTRDVYGTLYTLSPQDYSIGGEDYSIPVAIITYTPEANWFTEKQSYNPDHTEVKDAAGNTIYTHVAGREAGFDYSVTASNGATATFHADVALKNVNDAPVVTIKPQGLEGLVRGCPHRGWRERMPTAKSCTYRSFKNRSGSGSWNSSGWRMAAGARFAEVLE